MDRDFLLLRIENLKLQLIAVDDAILALTAAGGVQSYTLDTGQTRQTVTRADVVRLHELSDSLMNRIITLEYRLNGGNVTYARPDF